MGAGDPRGLEHREGHRDVVCYTGPMRRRALGSSGLSITELTLGTWQLSGEGHAPTCSQDRAKLLERARALGIEAFECAESYAHGEVLRQLGDLFGSDDKAQIVCLLGTDRESMPPRKRFDLEYLKAAFDRTLISLKRDRVDVLLLHNPSRRAFERTETIDWLRGLPSSGTVGAWGVSVGSTEVAQLAVDNGAQVVQLPQNILHTDELDSIATRIKEDGIGVLARSVLAHGLLCGMWPRDKEFPPGDHRVDRWTADELRRRIQQMNAIRPAVGGDIPSLRAVALRYVLHSPLVSSAVLGPRSALQLDQLVREASVSPPFLSDDKLRALEGRLRDVGVRS